MILNISISVFLLKPLKSKKAKIFLGCYKNKYFFKLPSLTWFFSSVNFSATTKILLEPAGHYLKGRKEIKLAFFLNKWISGVSQNNSIGHTCFVRALGMFNFSLGIHNSKSYLTLKVRRSRRGKISVTFTKKDEDHCGMTAALGHQPSLLTRP